MRSRYLLSLAGLVCLIAAGGASCLPRNMVSTAPPAPTAFSGFPTLDEFIQTVNGNSARVRQLQTSSASLTVAGYPALRADLALDPPRRFRLRAGTAIMGPELDLGSNDETFWVWVKKQSPPAVFYARHRDAENGSLHDVIPVPPSWLIEALGLVQLDPYAVHEGPYQRMPGRLEVRTRVPSPSGEWERVTVIDDIHGWVLEQHVKDSQGRLVASARLSRHHFDPAHGVSLPRQVDISLPGAQLEFTIQLHEFVINQLITDPLQLWSMPRMAGVEYVDLADPAARAPHSTGLPTGRVNTAWHDRQQIKQPWLRRYQGFSGIR